jgi:hypothetical protein
MPFATGTDSGGVNAVYEFRLPSDCAHPLQHQCQLSVILVGQLSNHQSEFTQAFKSSVREDSEKVPCPTKTPRANLDIYLHRSQLAALAVTSIIIRFSRPVPHLKLIRDGKQ